jgi:hypothetical protein
MLQPLNDIAILVPRDLSLMELTKSDSFGMKAAKDAVPEECLRWKIIAAGPGNFSSAGILVPNPLHIGDTIIIGGVSNRSLRETWAKMIELLDGQKFLLCRGFATEKFLIVVDREK